MEVQIQLILKYFQYIIYLFEVLPLIACIIFFKKIITQPLKVFFVYAITLAIFILLGYYFSNVIVNKAYYFLTVRTYCLIEYSILAFFFFKLLKNNFIKKLLIISIPIFLSFTFYNYLTTDKIAFNNYPFLVEFLVFILVLIYYFYEKMKIVTTYPLYQSISFWLCVGFFIYFTGNFFFLLFSTSSKDPAFLKQLRVVYSIVNITKDIILTLAWLAHEPTAEENTELRIPDDVHLDDEFTFTNKFINS